MQCANAEQCAGVLQVLNTAEAGRTLQMNDRYFFGLLERMTAGATHRAASMPKWLMQLHAPYASARRWQSNA